MPTETVTTMVVVEETNTSPMNMEEDKDKEQQQEQQEQEQPSMDATADVTATDSDITTSVYDKDDSSSSSSSASTTTTVQEHEDQEQKQDDANTYVDVEVLRRSIAKGMIEISHQERTQIEEEVHGIKSMGFSQEEESKPHVKALFLRQFKDHLENIMTNNANEDQSENDKDNIKADAISSSSSSSESNSESIDTDTVIPTATANAAYELCLRKNYTYATTETGELRLMCLRADMWDPKKACERFLRHLTTLHKYYGNEGLKQPLTIDHLDYEERDRNEEPSSSSSSSSTSSSSTSSSSGGSRGIYKKGNKGGSKRKGSLDSLPDMLALKSGSIQVLPSRDRAGRRVIVLQPGPSTATGQQTQLQVQKSKFKAMIYFLCALAGSDVDAQRKGLVLVLNSTKTDEKHIEQEYKVALINEYKELCQAIPIRFSAVHIAFDKDSKDSIPHKISMNFCQSYIDSNGNGKNPTVNMNIARIRFYDQDASNDAAKNKIASYGIPTHQIPATHTGKIKLKEHYQWIKIQEWSEKRRKANPDSKINVIECPGTNDVLFSQGGKHWNGVNRFQRGNLEFMEFLESKIDIYQSTLSWKKKHKILVDLVTEFATAPQSTGTAARFLETATQIEGVTAAPDGCWVELPLTSPSLMQKIRQTLLNHTRRLESSGKRKPAPSKAVRAKKNSKVRNAANKKSKLVHDSTRMSPSSHSMMKNNKLAMATFGLTMATFGGSISNNSYHAPNHRHHNESNISSSPPFTHKQTICEFLANAECIAVSTTAVEIACNSAGDTCGHEHHGGACTDVACDSSDNEDSLSDSTANDEKVVQAIIANDGRLNKEVKELFKNDSFLREHDEDIYCVDDDDGERDEMADFLRECML